MKRYVVTYCKLIALFYAALVLVFIIPEDNFRSQVEQVQYYIDMADGASPMVMDNEIAVLDTYTDVHMYQAMHRQEHNVWKAALDINGYARYWHGYLTVLRPLAVVFEYDEIRFLLGTIILLLFSLVTIKMQKRVGIYMAITHGAALALTFFTLSALCLQYVCCYVILFVGELLFLRKYHIEDMGYGFWLLFTLGMVTNYFDFLTYPVITLGGLLLLMIYIHYLEDTAHSFKKSMYILIRGTVCWGIGYGMTWFTKWIVASLVLRKNIILDALQQAAYRSYGGNDTNAFSAMIFAIRKNLGSLLMNRNGILLAIILTCCIITFFFGILHHKEEKALIPAVLIAAYPYVWYIVLAQHSIQHAYFTYKAQMITIWAVLLLGAEMVGIIRKGAGNAHHH